MCAFGRLQVLIAMHTFSLAHWATSACVWTRSSTRHVMKSSDVIWSKWWTRTRLLPATLLGIRARTLHSKPVVSNSYQTPLNVAYCRTAKLVEAIYCFILDVYINIRYHRRRLLKNMSAQFPLPFHPFPFPSFHSLLLFPPLPVHGYEVWERVSSPSGAGCQTFGTFGAEKVLRVRAIIVHVHEIIITELD